MPNQKPLVKTFKIEAFVICLVVSVIFVIACMQTVSYIESKHLALIIGAVTSVLMASFLFRSIQKIPSLDRLNLALTKTSCFESITGSSQYRSAEAGMGVFL